MYVKVKVKTGQRKESLKEITENRYEISVKEKAIENRANARVLELIAAEYKLNSKQIRIISGHHSPSKILLIS